MTIPFVDLKAQYASIEAEVNEAIANILHRCDFVAGESVSAFEDAWARYCDVKHAIAVSNGTDALHLALRALGIRPGDEVIIPAHTFVATAEAVTMTGGTPVVADIDPVTYTLDPACVEAAITPRTRAVLPVHLYGLPADMDALADLCARHDLFLVEDACQAHGAEYRGRRAGGIGHVSAFSFYPGKNLGAYGDAGGITTNDADLAARIRLLRDHGSPIKYRHVEPGFCARMDTIQAAVLNVKLPHLDTWNARRRRVAGWYAEHLNDVEGVIAPAEPPWGRSVFHLYAVIVADRDAAIEALRDAGIASGIHYPVPVHLQQAYASMGLSAGSMPHSEYVAAHELSLPMYPEMTEEQVDKVVETLQRAVPSPTAPAAVTR